MTPIQALLPTAFLGELGAGELLIIFVVALLLFGSKRLPDLARSLGKAMEEFRRAARVVSSEIVNAPSPPKTPPPVKPAALPEGSTPPEAGPRGEDGR